MPKRPLCLATAAACLALNLSHGAAAQEPALTLGAIRNSAGPILDLEAPFWKNAPSVKVPMQPQVIANPQNATPAVAELDVRGVHNGQWYAVLIEWADPSRSDRIVVDQFGDQVAVQMPVAYKPGDVPNPMMGGPGERMNIVQWRAAFQHDVDASDTAEGGRNGPRIAELYPNAHVDVYPDEVLRATDARAYTGAVGLDNPVSRPKKSAVIEQMAEGFGSLTAMPEQHADGRGTWADGKWRVIITHPLAAGDANAPLLKPGDQTLAAFAVWEGGAQEVGSRKAWSNWVQLTFGSVKP